MNLIRSFLDNDSVFGKLMTRCGILIGANLMFILFCIPVVTIGTSCSALYYTMMKTLRGEDELNPFATFWKAFRENWKQTVPIWLALLILAVFLRLELFWCSQFTGLIAMFRYGIMAILVLELILAIYIFPVIAAFEANWKQQIINAIYFAFGNPLHLLQIVFFHVAPVILTYVFFQYLPLFAFIWTVVGFSSIAMFSSSLMLKQFTPFLPADEICSHKDFHGDEVFYDDAFL